MKGLRGCRFAFVLTIVLALFGIATDRCAAAEPATTPAMPTSPAMPRGVVALTSNEPDIGPAKAGPLLARELIRQAVLIAARDQLQLQTRDQTLREPFPAEASLANSILDLRLGGGPPIHVRIRRLGDLRMVWSGDLQIPNWNQDVLALVEQAEQLSRSGFPEALRASGWTGSPDVDAADSPIPDAIETDLQRMEIVSQFAAVRELHRLIRQEGQSPQRLGALVRGYANLGQLTRFLWSDAHDVFAARSLLYAQRLFELDHGSAVALWHRAYARAMAGLHAAALEDLDAGSRAGSRAALPAASLPSDSAPAWVALLGPYCRYDAPALTALAEHDAATRPLALFLAFTCTRSSNCQGSFMRTATPALQANPQCAAIYDAMLDQTGPGMRNSLVREGPAVFGQTLAQRLVEIPQMPKPVLDLIRVNTRPDGNPAGRVEVCKALLQLGSVQRDDGEPSWSCLARLIEDTTFIQSWRWINHIAYYWGVDATDAINEILPLIADHPYAAAVRVMMYAHHPDPAARDALLRTLRFVDAQGTMLPLIRQMYVLNPIEDADGRQINGDLVYNVSPCAEDLERIIRAYQNGTNRPWQVEDWCTVLKRVSPYSPIAMVYTIRVHWDPAQAGQWEKDYGHQPAVARELAHQYYTMKRYDDAERCARQYIEQSPDRWGYFQLAATFAARKQGEQYVRTLQAFLEQPDYGLEHAQAQTQIANYLMRQGDYDRAVAYADQAAQTAAHWALRCAARAHELAGHWQQAEAYEREAAEHYDTGLDWYEWCRRTGHGDVQAAHEAAVLSLAHRARAGGRAPLVDNATLHLLDGSADAAVPLLRQSLDEFGDAWAGLHLALFYQEAHDPVARDAALERVIEKAPGHLFNGRQRDEMIQLARVVRAASASAAANGGDPLKLALDDRQVSQAVSLAPVSERANVEYFAARFYDLFDQSQPARQYYLRSAGISLLRDNINRDLAWIRLRELGIDPPATAASTTDNQTSDTEAEPVP